MAQTIVTDTGFAPDDWNGCAAPLADGLPANATAVDVAPSDDVTLLADALTRLTMIRIGFPSSADGRGFTLARRLRAMGYRGRLRADGHVLADQYAMARRSGFDEVAIDAALAARQPEDQWLARADWRAHDYQARLRGASLARDNASRATGVA
ncbi:DUF934 domain-containing protein [Gymnodinialimonas ceratoperidinii]|uniref:DUF934 domain-containing protein n=1 Tax=Gymnodinialimonas ceratoperidinii TaxID=2856823 RepID=A0A8F6YC14_9RHOB|nr:DUF934 domain-containing protein [Gymnodinialimonas ceratoperidinii]QXT38800.1 DUF934 domain-containing protein [Gymnodinialimonas ceratoperidinii]